MLACVVAATGCFKNKKISQTVEKPQVILPAGVNVMILATQQHGGSVVVDGVRLSASGFIVIRDDLYGKPGVVVGVSPLLPAGEAQHLELDLLRDFSGAEQLYAELHHDNGDRRFRQVDDLPVKDAEGQEIVVQFAMEGPGDPFVDVGY